MKTQQQIELDPDASLAAIRAVRATARRRCTWGKSRLTKHRAELEKLHADRLPIWRFGCARKNVS